ncbi:uncharacterized protein PAC_15450 [Phialocephala subalpina]|uniref:Glutaminase A N-terminal domain-containing protein n=1 Tax=Phialocephala subalpina TaxID=576137 RepID=A0A1L7XKG9_9HELO|nr:uncharacterized protein PAC_15450 [Phialocephala subalpina]
MNTWLEVGSDGGSGGVLPGSRTGPRPGPVAGSNDGSGTSKWLLSSQCYSNQIMNIAGKVSMNVTFLSPITPTDPKRQSVIGSYLSVTVAAIDSATHSVQLYAGTPAEWVSIHNGDVAQWRTGFQVTNHGEKPRANSMQIMLTMQLTGATVHGTFLNSGVLPNTQDTNYRAIGNSWPVFAFGWFFRTCVSPKLTKVVANSPGNVGSTPVSTLYTIVHAQQNAIYFDGAKGNTAVPSLWTNYFGS